MLVTSAGLIAPALPESGASAGAAASPATSVSPVTSAPTVDACRASSPLSEARNTTVFMAVSCVDRTRHEVRQLPDGSSPQWRSEDLRATRRRDDFEQSIISALPGSQPMSPP